MTIGTTSTRRPCSSRSTAARSSWRTQLDRTEFCDRTAATKSDSLIAPEIRSTRESRTRGSASSIQTCTPCDFSFSASLRAKNLSVELWLRKTAGMAISLRRLAASRLRRPEGALDPVPGAVLLPLPVVAEGGVPVWQVRRNVPPGAFPAEGEEDGVEDGPARVFGGPPARLGRGDERLDHGPLLVGEPGRVGGRFGHPCPGHAPKVALTDKRFQGYFSNRREPNWST